MFVDDLVVAGISIPDSTVSVCCSVATWVFICVVSLHAARTFVNAMFVTEFVPSLYYFCVHPHGRA